MGRSKSFTHGISKVHFLNSTEWHSSYEGSTASVYLKCLKIHRLLWQLPGDTGWTKRQLLENQKCNCFDKKRRGLKNSKYIMFSVKGTGKEGKALETSIKENKYPTWRVWGEWNFISTIILFPPPPHPHPLIFQPVLHCTQILFIPRCKVNCINFPPAFTWHEVSWK